MTPAPHRRHFHPSRANTTEAASLFKRLTTLGVNPCFPLIKGFWMRFVGVFFGIRFLLLACAVALERLPPEGRVFTFGWSGVFLRSGALRNGVFFILDLRGVRGGLEWADFQRIE